MRNNLSCLVWRVGGSLALALIGPICVLAAEATLPATAEPADLVKAALKTELDGPSEARKELLDEALARDPDFAPARWHSGFVRFDGEWLKVEDVPRRARGIEHLAEYRKLRDKLVDTADNHRALARWCHKSKLLDEERVHWAKVLEFEHADVEALEALGLQLYNGRLLTKSQIDAEKKQAGEARRAMQRWQPQMVKWRKAIEHGSPKQLDEALRGLKELADPAAIPALEVVFAVNGEAPKQVELNKLLIETVGRMPVPEATQVLLRRAIIPDSLEVRTAATAALKHRPMFTYVPQLIAAFPYALQTRCELTQYTGGVFVSRQEMSLVGRDSDVFVSREFFDVPVLVRNPDHGNAPPNLELILRQIWAIGANRWMEFCAAEANAEQYRRQSEHLKARLQFALEQTTGFADAADPDLWDKQYNQYYDWYTSPYTIRRQYQSIEGGVNAIPVFATHSCFVAGTPVSTMAGPSPIEKVKIGDRVLAQNPENGEVGYKTVQNTTVRPAMPIVEIQIGGNSITGTRGHPFWVAGQGWRVAKFLNLGDQLHGLNGATVVSQMQVRPAAEVYNLVVSEWHTYFVGEQQLLVHDNSPMEEISAVVPGLAPDGKVSSVAAQRQAQP